MKESLDEVMNYFEENKHLKQDINAAKLLQEFEERDFDDEYQIAFLEDFEDALREAAQIQELE